MTGLAIKNTTTAFDDIPEHERIYDPAICSVCKRYVDKETQGYVDKPTEGVCVSHTYCPACLEEVMKEWRAWL